MTPQDALRKWRTDLGLSLAKAAKMIGVSAPTLCDYEHGKKRPRDARRKAIAIVVGIEPSRWDTDEERELVDRARAVGASAPAPRARPARARPARSPSAPRAA